MAQDEVMNLAKAYADAVRGMMDTKGISYSVPMRKARRVRTAILICASTAEL